MTRSRVCAASGVAVTAKAIDSSSDVRERIRGC